jgi:hypothetical protein
MNLLRAIGIVALAVGVAVLILLAVRRRAPEGGFFTDGDRAAGVFGVLATGFSVLLGLVVFLAFTSYDQARSGAEAEALLVEQQFETAQFFPRAVRTRMADELVCYGRSVVHQEWPDMQDGEQEFFNPWAVAMFRTLEGTSPKTVAEESAYDKFVDRRAERETARRDRVHGAAGVIPGPLWVALFFITAVIFGFMLFFADRSEHAFVQAVQIGSVIAVVASTLLLIEFLDHPMRPGYGGLRPVAMEQSLRRIDQARLVVHQTGPLPCDKLGRASGS